ncbi:hypothetical protein Fot_42282 [Forsythia ovata]|uniref:Uncharacterized protein n=1 Tax=Forsythia ovata TaxID=205694 RepID=A0ABD1RKP8_9LAMI
MDSIDEYGWRKILRRWIMGHRPEDKFSDEHDVLSFDLGVDVSNHFRLLKFVDDRFYTKEVLKQVDEVIRSASNAKEYFSIQIGEVGMHITHVEVTSAMLQKRQQKLGWLLRSPFLSAFDSMSGFD